MEARVPSAYFGASFRPWSVIMQDLIWIGIAAGLALLGLMYVSLAGRA